MAKGDVWSLNSPLEQRNAPMRTVRRVSTRLCENYEVALLQKRLSRVSARTHHWQSSSRPITTIQTGQLSSRLTQACSRRRRCDALPTLPRDTAGPAPDIPLYGFQPFQIPSPVVLYRIHYSGN
ncbi:hypothetical protein SprV_0902747800 [Sparganum proliferum]